MRAALIACLLAVAASVGGLNLLAADLGTSAPVPSAQAADPSTVAFDRARRAAERRAET